MNKELIYLPACWTLFSHQAKCHHGINLPRCDCPCHTGNRKNPWWDWFKKEKENQ